MEAKAAWLCARNHCNQRAAATEKVFKRFGTGGATRKRVGIGAMAEVTGTAEQVSDGWTQTIFVTAASCL